MTPLDWIFVAALVYSTVRAAMRGFVRVAFSLTGAAAGFLLAAWYAPTLAPHLAGLLLSPQLRAIAAFALLLFGTLVAFGLMGMLVHRATTAVGLGWANRLAGAVFGLLRGAVLCAGVLTGMLAFLPSAPWVTKSRLAPILLRGVHAVSFGMPDELRSRVGEAAASLKHTQGGWIK